MGVPRGHTLGPYITLSSYLHRIFCGAQYGGQCVVRQTNQLSIERRLECCGWNILNLNLGRFGSSIVN